MSTPERKTWLPNKSHKKAEESVGNLSDTALSQCVPEKVSEVLVPFDSLWGILIAPPVSFISVG